MVHIPKAYESSKYRPNHFNLTLCFISYWLSLQLGQFGIHSIDSHCLSLHQVLGKKEETIIYR